MMPPAGRKLHADPALGVSGFLLELMERRVRAPGAPLDREKLSFTVA